ncbi:hypothetical protein [Phenylobacterium sp.]|uniref:hypothetical protein n=1 Tax=Phenylobacterium sp. TaxID=1871053 RepID=UPI00374DB0E4
MLALILAFASQALALQASPSPASTPQAPPTTVTGVEVTAQAKGKPPPADVTVNMQASDDDLTQMVTIWPGAAYQNRVSGRVRLRCRIDVHGLAETCEIASEVPQGKGFGKAALELRPTFKLAPTLGPDGPIAATKIIAIGFKAPDSQISGKQIAETLAMNSVAPDMSQITFGNNNPIAMRDVTMLDRPVWAQAASFDDLARAYPARGGGVEGYAVDHCRVLRTGLLDNCQIIKEEPEGRGFDKAALSLASKFKVVPEQATVRQRSPVWVDIAIRLPPPDQLKDRTVMAPIWLLGVDPNATPKVFPPEAAAQGLATGRGVTRCTIGAGGTMSACVPEPGEPDGLGFSEAAARLASQMKMNLWSADAAPVQGGVVHIPIRLNLRAPG